MGYEVCYKYYEKVDGDYKKDDLKSFKRKIGDPFEDTPLEKVSSAIIAQFARRDIWIVDVEVFELSKKRIAFKETKGGIVLKNKKFLFDSVEANLELKENEIDHNETEEEAPTTHQQEVSDPESPAIAPKPKPLSKKRVIDNLIFSPEPQQFIEAKRKNLKLTVDKKYEVYQKKPSPNGLGDLCLIIDDAGNEQFVTDMYFIPASINLFADRELGFSENQQQKDEVNLWGNASLETNMPNIRRR